MRGWGTRRFGIGTARLGLAAVIASVVGGGALAGSGCAPDFDKTRATANRGTLGREMFTMVCDRVGAQALREDVAGASYHAVCHASAAGDFASEVDTGKLPALGEAVDVEGKVVTLEQQARNRDHRIARIHAVARRRDDLIAAFDTAFANEAIATKDLGNPDPARSCDPPSGAAGSGEADLRPELAEMLGRLTDLYNDDTIPHLTRALSGVMKDLEASPDAQAALVRFDARRGYRPADISMGVARPTMSYPRLVELANALLRLLASDTDPLRMASAERVPGKASAPLASMLSIMKEELRTAKAVPDLPRLAVAKDPRDARFERLSRPRGNLEMARTIFLAQDPAFAIGEPRWIVARDARGFARVALAEGKVPSPFLDQSGPTGAPDGLPDVDELGRFKTIAAYGAEAPTPFVAFGSVGFGAGGDAAASAPGAVKRDNQGRAPAYEYIDVSSTYLAALTRDLIPLLEPDPKREHETIMDLLAGFSVVAGERQAGSDSVRRYEAGGKKNEVAYRGFRDDQSPLLDLVHAVGQLLADPATEDTLALVQQLAQDKPQVLARLMGAGFRIKEIADQHPEATLPAGSTLWDEMLDVFVRISQKPKLVEDIVRAFGDPRTLELAKSGAAYMEMRDHLSYDRNDLNGAPFNVTKSKVETLVTPVDRSKADTGFNRSVFQRFLQTLHDANGLSVCTKPGAVAHIVWSGVALDFPSFASTAACFTLGADVPPNPMPRCGMFRIENIANDLVDAVLGQVKLDIRDDCLRKLVSSPLNGIVGGADAFLENVSGIKGFNTKPTVPGIARVVFFDLPQGASPGDTQNAKTRNFLRDLFDPPETLVCPPRPFTDTDGHVLNLRDCSGAFADSIRGRDLDALFPLETMGFLESAKPLAKAFADNQANLLFVDLFDTLHLHWGSDRQTAQECSKSGPRTSARWCSQDGAVTYEPLIAAALKSDLFPAMHDSVKELSAIRIAHCDTRDAKGACTKTTGYDGVKVLAEAVKAMVDPARNKGLQQRNGDAGVVRNDGTKNTQVTPVYLLIDALKGFDAAFEARKAEHAGDDRLPQWRRGRSQIVDQLFAVAGTGAAAKLKNPAVEKLLPTLVGTVRSQLAANCPDPAQGCTWARKDLPNKMRDVVTGPTFATVLDVLDVIRSDEAARTELERLLVFLLQSVQADASRSTLAALSDLLQVFEDDASVTALLNGVAQIAGPEVKDPDGRVVSRGLLLAAIEVMSRILGEARTPEGTRLCAKEIDPNRTLAVVLRRLVTPPADGRLAAPIEVLIDVAADVNRVRPETTTKLDAADYAHIAREVSDFCAHQERGLEQVYTVIKQATQ